MKFFLLTGLVLVLSFSCAKRPDGSNIPSFSPDVFLERSGKRGSETFRYRVFVPKDRKPGERLPVMLYLHGADDRGDDNQLQLRGLAEHIKTHPQDFRFIIVFPQCPANRFWDNEIIWQAEDALQQSISEFDGDESRLYLAGFSLGGFGVWTRAVTHPMEFAAIVPMSGRVLPRPNEKNQLGDYVLELADAPDPYADYADRIGNTPVWIFHGADDRTVPVDGSRRMLQALKNVGNENVIFSELQGIGHYTVDAAFGNPDLFTWLARQKRANISYENLEVNDDMVYGAVLGAIAYDDDNKFGPIAGGRLLHLKRETISPENPNEPLTMASLTDDLRQDFLKNNRTGDKLRSDGYDAKVFINVTEKSGSVKEIFEHDISLDNRLYGVVGFSKVGFDADHSRSIVYVEVYTAENKLQKNYCLINWKRDGNGLMIVGRRWLL